MTSIPPSSDSPSGPSPIIPQPATPQPANVAPSAPLSSNDQALMNSPFAQMFARSGATPTVEEMKKMMDMLLRDQIAQIKKSDEAWKRAMKKIKEAFEDS